LLLAFAVRSLAYATPFSLSYWFGSKKLLGRDKFDKRKTSVKQSSMRDNKNQFFVSVCSKKLLGERFAIL
jgi:hypothetical protein